MQAQMGPVSPPASCATSQQVLRSQRRSCTHDVQTTLINDLLVSVTKGRDVGQWCSADVARLPRALRSAT